MSEFEDILMRPHHFIFNREWYEIYEGRAQFVQYEKEFSRLSSADRTELLSLISGVDPRQFPGQVKLATSSRVRSILQHHLPLTKNEEATIWVKQRAIKQQVHPSIIVPDEERVEDAGLNYEEAPTPVPRKLTAVGRR